MIRPEISGQRAFTIMESLAVMLTIVLLASIVIPGLLGRVSKKPKFPMAKPLAGAVGQSKPAVGLDAGAPAVGKDVPLADPKPDGATR